VHKLNIKIYSDIPGDYSPISFRGFLSYYTRYSM